MPAISAITGWGQSSLSRRPGPSVAELARDACIAAVEHAGMAWSEIDGLILGQSDILDRSALTLAFRHSLDLGELNLLCVTEGKGTTVLQAIHHASLAVSAGMARTVLCVFSDTPIRDEKQAGDTFARPSKIMNLPDWETRYGCFGAIGAYALAASAYRGLYGFGEDAYSPYVITCRKWAALNPEAFLRDEIDTTAYFASPAVVEPLRLLDCAYPVNGAAAFVITGTDRAKASAGSPVFVHGIGQGHNERSALSALVKGGRTGAQTATNGALAGAGLDISSIDCLQVYDAFSFSGVFALEDFGFLPAGGAVEFIRAGETAPGGSLPMNTGGGHLSSYYLQGATPLIEALRQASGAAGARQVPKHDTVFITNSGGCLEFHATLVVSPHRSLS